MGIDGNASIIRGRPVLEMLVFPGFQHARSRSQVWNANNANGRNLTATLETLAFSKMR